jgi:magnesium-transporting ATPase (P-type)
VQVGDILVVDAIVVSVTVLCADESVLTGESEFVVK